MSHRAWRGTLALSIVGVTLILAVPVGAGVPTGPLEDGLSWLEANQNPNGSWGSGLEVVVTGAVLETLSAVAPESEVLPAGAGWLAAQPDSNHEFLARKIVGLGPIVGFEDIVTELTNDLMAVRNPVEVNSALPNWPEGGWGVAAGFGTDSLTTALAMLALEVAGLNGGFQVNNAALAPATTNVHEWEIPGDATTARILISVAGSEVRLRMTEGAPPTIFDPFFILPPGGPYAIVFPDSGLPFTAGTNFISIESPDPPALAATYTMTASYQTPTFDTRTLAEPLDYLRQAQNPDGGWGLQRGLSSDFYTTLHVLLGLLRYDQYDFDAELASGVTNVRSMQLGDGSFGFGGPGIPYVTGLAALTLIRSDGCPPSAETVDAFAALLTMQDVDGSWDQQGYDTTLAMLAIQEFDPDADGVLADGDCSGVAGDGRCPDGITASCDDNCAETSNAVQADGDGDLFGDACDCDVSNGMAWSDPQEPTLFLSQEAGVTEILWSLADPGGTSPVLYDTLRSTDPSDFATVAVCLESDELDAVAMDPANPAAGDVFNYLARAENACPTSGTLGNDSSGAPRTGINCP